MAYCHTHQKDLSSPCGMFDGLCEQCEANGEDAHAQEMYEREMRPAFVKQTIINVCTHGSADFEILVEKTGARPSIIRWWLKKLGAKSYLDCWMIGSHAEFVKMAASINGVDW